VESRRASVKDLLNKLRNSSTRSPVFGELIDLLLGGDLSSDQKPEETLRKRLLATGGFRKSLLNFGDGLAAETNSLLCDINQYNQ
jgi:hypothetical protein